MSVTDNRPAAIVVDVDGTVALMGQRDPYDETTVADDAPNQPVIAVAESMTLAGYRLVFVSGRTDACRADTETWLDSHIRAPKDALHMRAVGDRRRDADVKTEIYRTHIEPRYRVLVVLDDRNQTVDAWRALGLTCLQVAPGDF